MLAVGSPFFLLGAKSQILFALIGSAVAFVLALASGVWASRVGGTQAMPVVVALVAVVALGLSGWQQVKWEKEKRRMDEELPGLRQILDR